jgi:hypothetical protein
MERPLLRLDEQGLALSSPCSQRNRKLIAEAVWQKHCQFIRYSKTTNCLRNVMRSNESITTYYVPGQLADVGDLDREAETGLLPPQCRELGTRRELEEQSRWLCVEDCLSA